MTQEKLENTVIELFLDYGDETSSLLLNQLEHLEVKKREFTGIGFFTHFHSPDNLKVENISKTYEDLSVDIKDPDDNMHFLLFIKNGSISCLEAFTFRGWKQEDLSRIDPDSFYGGGRSAFFSD